MLGLGLGFTKGMFSKFSSKLEVPPPNIPATPEEPIVIPTETIEVLKNKGFDFTVNYYNDYDTGVATPSISCGSDVSPSPWDMTRFQSSGQKVESGTYKPFKFIVDPLQVAGKSICTLKFSVTTTAGVAETEKQIIIIAK
jgi:hypothetical protein